ncbi:MAG: M61 family peptidase [Bacteroidota bacterium]
MKYIISYSKPNNHYIDIEFIADKINQDEIVVQLPAWRPGRYELGNFAKNIQKWNAFDEGGNALKFEKITKDSWKLKTAGVSSIHIKYNYYAAELNAGSTFLDCAQLYMNPVNCCVYIPNRIDETCELILQLPIDYKVACGQAQSLIQPDEKGENKTGKNLFVFQDFHELADSPFIASNSLQHNKFICFGVEFNFWFQGECKPDWAKLTSDFMKFINEQLLIMNDFPSKKYHFLFQILPFRTYHGVEHTTSTVIALGPGCSLMKGNLYDDLLGVSSHELFHAWNIKTIRPVEMQPYDYSKENYSKLGYVCEGITTYYGDYILLRSGVFNEQQYFQTFAERLQKHFDNFGRFNLSVADASFDTWLDGYSPGVPNRKTSIYDEGCLLAFVTDIFIRKNSNNERSLDDVMRYLYKEFALKGKGYSGSDYKGIVEHFANSSYDVIYNNYINAASDYEPILRDAMEFIGCELILASSTKFHEHSIGIKVAEVNGACKITAVFPNSVADISGISINDEIIAINNIQIKTDSSGTNFSEWCNYFGNKPVSLTISSNGIINQMEIIPEPNSYYKIAGIRKMPSVNENQSNNFNKWSNNKLLS